MVAATALVASSSWAKIRVCVEIDAKPSEREGLRRLVMNEVNRHPTHEAVSSDCEAVLSVEVVELGPELGGERNMTARLDAEVPAREQLREGNVAATIEHLVTLVLHNDPRRLSGPQRDDWIGRTREAFLRRGTLSLGLELYETLALVDGRLQGLSGVALSGRRELDRIHFGIRLAAASAFEVPRYRLALSQEYQGQIELAFFSSADADIAAFGSLGLGLEVQHFQGPSQLASPGVESATSSGAALMLRGGAELLRSTSTRVQLFAALTLPAFASKDASGALVNQWTPTLALGVGGYL